MRVFQLIIGVEIFHIRQIIRAFVKVDDNTFFYYLSSISNTLNLYKLSKKKGCSEDYYVDTGEYVIMFDRY